ncbi:hypothetical protein GGP44_003077 [Salinibacter ruber]|nr:hypothetical protein [Salinibacter ruber]
MPKDLAADVDTRLDLDWCEVLKRQLPPQG